MGILTWVLLGLVVGVIAKWIMPGDDPGGFFITILLGVAGAFIGGYVGSALGIGAVSGFNLMSLALATAGAVALLALYRAVRK